MIGRLKAFAKRHWPRLRLRTILFAVLFFTAAMPGIGAISLRVYENTLVRQTEARVVRVVRSMIRSSASTAASAAGSTARDDGAGAGRSGSTGVRDRSMVLGSGW